MVCLSAVLLKKLWGNFVTFRRSRLYGTRNNHIWG